MAISLNIFGGLFAYIGYAFGYVLWGFFELTNNYGASIILFTLLVMAIQTPFSIKQQKSMAKNMRMQEKQKELQKKYGKDKRKLQEEQAKLYAEEGMNPVGGCLATFVPFIILMGVWNSVNHPLQSTLHIAASEINKAMAFLQTIPGIGAAFGSQYGEIEVIKLFPYVQNELTMFSPAEIENIAQFHSGFNFLGLDLLSTASTSPFSSGLWIIPVLSFVTYTISTWVMQKVQGSTQVQGQGCMKYSMYVMNLWFTWLAYISPAAVGVYWISMSVLRTIQSLILNKYYNIHILNAKSEAARIALRRQQEKDIKPAR